ncbi:TetR/AcrR family transcriptional regulator [Patulibacter sp. S7RM1-6]
MARPSRIQTQRRQQIVEAARRSIVEHGLENVGVRDIAQEAGLSPGSITYYYPALDDLLQQVQDEATARFSTQRWKLVEEIEGPAERLVRIIEYGIAESADDELYALLYEFTGLARRNPTYRRMWKLQYDRHVPLYESVLATGAGLGVFSLARPAATIAHHLVGLEDSFAFHVLTGVSFDREEAIGLMLDYASVATGCDLAAVRA